VDANAREHFHDHDRLGDAIDAAGFEPAHDVFGFCQPGHNNHGHVGQPGILLQAAAGLKTVHARHHRVEQDDVGVICSTIRIAEEQSSATITVISGRA
jgi:hypothetical protein